MINYQSMGIDETVFRWELTDDILVNFSMFTSEEGEAEIILCEYELKALINMLIQAHETISE